EAEVSEAQANESTEAEAEAVENEEASEEENAEEAAEESEEGGKLFRRKGRKDKRELQKKDEEIAALKDRLMRSMAEFDNYRKRTEKEKAAMYGMGAKDVVEKILPVVDNFERGIAALPEGSEEDPVAQGMTAIYKQFTGLLEALDIKPIEAVGQPFDPNMHNAVMHVDDETVGENIVVEEFQKGYMYKTDVLRYSMVKVAN
ncbi:MAG: nucleotide exchange factor GrpE, partial [Lachnospiraceae bacterium]|nr:nucleotide exchange factor GrpE [Candidatus Equihabitans merdae]